MKITASKISDEGFIGVYVDTPFVDIAIKRAKELKRKGYIINYYDYDGLAVNELEEALKSE